MNNHNSNPDHDADVRTFLERWDEITPDAVAKARLITALKAIPLPLPSVNAAPMPFKAKLHQAWLIMKAQVRLIGAPTWVASMFVIALGLLVTLAMLRVDSGGLAFVMVAPIVTAMGVAFLYGDEIDPALEIQSATPISPRLILLARLALLFSFDLIVTTLASVVLAASSADISLVPLIASWLAPMTFLSALAFVCSVLFFDPLMSALLALAIWVAAVVRHAFELPFLVDTPDLLAPEVRPLLYVIALIAVAVGLTLSAREDYVLRSSHE